MRVRTPLAFLAAFSLLPGHLLAQNADQVRLASRALEWRELGPTIMGGRISDLAVVESDPATFYVGTATAGIWKTENSGITFEALFQHEGTSSIGDVTVAPSNPNVVWVGTGEPQNRQRSPWGDGVYRSLDAGATWTHLGLENTHHISRIQVHPRDPDVAYVAAVGHLWGPNLERGVYKTSDGGGTWSLVLFVDEHTGAIDLVMDPNDPHTLFAAMYQRRRTAWGFNGGGPGSGIYRTTDGGASWTELTEGIPEGDKGRIGLDIYRGDGKPRLRARRGRCAHSGAGLRWRRKRRREERPLLLDRSRGKLGAALDDEQPPYVLLSDPDRPQRPRADVPRGLESVQDVRR